MKIQFSHVLAHGDIVWSEDENKRVIITFLQDHIIQRFFRTCFRLKIPKQRDIILDEKTSVIWKLIDGEKTIQTIFDEFQQNFMEEEQSDLEARFGSVIHYFLSQKWVQVKE